MAPDLGYLDAFGTGTYIEGGARFPPSTVCFFYKLKMILGVPTERIVYVYLYIYVYSGEHIEGPPIWTPPCIEPFDILEEVQDDN